MNRYAIAAVSAALLSSNVSLAQNWPTTAQVAAPAETAPAPASVAAESAPPSSAASAPVVAAPSLDGMIESALTRVVSRIAGTKGRVAVMDFPSLEGHATSLSSYISNKAGNKLIEVGRQVVDRATLEKVISEQKLQQNSLMDAATAARVGKLAGAGVFIIGNYTLLKSKFVLTVRALSVESGQFIPGAVAEETVKPLPTEMASEVHELAGATRAAASDVNLEGAATASDEAAPATAGNTKELEFDKAMCDALNRGMPLGKVFKIATDHDMLTSEQIHAEAQHSSNLTDTTGEMKEGYAFGHWQVAADNGYFDRSRLGRAIKGKFDNYPSVLAWNYAGDNEFAGKANCVPHPGWWTENREGGGSAKKKKK